MPDNKTKLSFPGTLPGYLCINADEQGDKTGLREKDLGIWQEVTWSDYKNEVADFCLGLKELGLKRGERLAIIGDNCKEWVYTDLAAQSLGAVAVGIYATNPSNQVLYILDHSDAVIVVAKDQEQADKILEIQDDLPKLKKLVVIDMKGLRSYNDPILISYKEVAETGKKKRISNPDYFDNLVRQTASDYVAVMVYTSGTTGPPKGAMLTHKNLLAFAESFNQLSRLNQNEQIVSYLPLCHVAERLMSVVLALYSGYTVNFTESVATVQESLYEISPTIFVGVPRIWEKMHAGIMINMKDASYFKRMMFAFWFRVGKSILQKKLEGKGQSFVDKMLQWLGYICMYRSILDKLGLTRVKLALSGAAPISPEILKFFRVLGFPISQVYGQTECSGVSHYQPGDGLDIGSVGKVLPGIRFKLADDGEILVKGDTVFPGYYKDEAASENTLREGWLYTGDVGTIDQKGLLYITDRKKDILITSGGKNIAPSEIENRLKFSPYINEAIVVGDRKPYLTALIQIEMDTVSKWATDRNITFTTFKSLASSDDVFNLIKIEIEEANKEFAQVETIKKFILLDKELDHDDDELTATMKVRRSAIEEKFKDKIASMYGK